VALLPEDYVLPEVYYTEERAKQYDQNSRIRQIQQEMTLRALEILDLHPPAVLLDLGCGTGLSMQIVKEKGFEAYYSPFDGIKPLKSNVSAMKLRAGIARLYIAQHSRSGMSPGSTAHQ
jgi:hypothetical protein